MKLGIIGAMEEEVELLRAQIENPNVRTIAHCEMIEGILEGTEVVLVKSGIGKVNAALATTLLLNTYEPDVVINTGSAGGFGEGLTVGTIVISDEVTHHDADATVFGYVYGQIPQMPETFKSDARLMEVAQEAVAEIGEHPSAIGLIASADTFMADPALVEKTRARFPKMIAAEMEAAAVAQICYQFGTPFVVIRALSDIAGVESNISFDEFLPVAAKHSTEIVLRVLSKLN